MSRLFDALKEATRFRENASAGEAAWKALGINGVEVTPRLDQAAVRAGQAGSVVVEEELLQSEAAPVNRSLGIPTKVTLDKNNWMGVQKNFDRCIHWINLRHRLDRLPYV